MKKIEVTVTTDVERLIAERDAILNKSHYQKGDGERLYQVQVLLCGYWCDQYQRAALCQ